MYYEPSDTMRRAPLIPLSEEDKNAVDAIKIMGQDFHNDLGRLGASRELSIAKTKLEEAVMWAVKHITK